MYSERLAMVILWFTVRLVCRMTARAREVLSLYKCLLRYGRGLTYTDKNYYFRRIREEIEKSRALVNPGEIDFYIKVKLLIVLSLPISMPLKFWKSLDRITNDGFEISLSSSERAGVPRQEAPCIKNAEECISAARSRPRKRGPPAGVSLSPLLFSDSVDVNRSSHSKGSVGLLQVSYSEREWLGGAVHQRRWSRWTESQQSCELCSVEASSIRWERKYRA